MADENAQETKAHQVPEDVPVQETKAHSIPDDADLDQPLTHEDEPKRKFFRKRKRDEEGPEEDAAQAGYEPSGDAEPEPEPEPEAQAEPEREPEPEPVVEEPAAVAEATPEISTEGLAQAAPEPETVEAAGTSAAAPPPDSPAGADERSDTPAWAPELSHGTAVDRPEILVAGAFAGGFLFAQILKRFGRD